MDDGLEESVVRRGFREGPVEVARVEGASQLCAEGVATLRPARAVDREPEAWDPTSVNRRDAHALPSRRRGGSLVCLLRVSGLAAVVGVASGIASALFLVLLDRVTAFRIAHEAIVYTIPLAGLAIGAIYERWGGSIRGGQNLVLDTIHEGSSRLPLRMAPMVLFGTVLTHLFGGSAGREGTAVQMGAGLADAIAHRFGLDPTSRRRLLAAGIAGGFGSVFGTPIAGAVFGVEVLTIGSVDLGAVVPVVVASLVGDVVTRALGIVHTAYPHVTRVETTLPLLGKLAVIGIAMAIAAVVFLTLTHRLKDRLSRSVSRLPVRMFVGGIGIVVMWKVVGTSDYLGLGVPTIVRAFSAADVPTYAFAAKLVFTAVTLSAGFLGGEVTPLFFVGATLGSVLARALGIPIELGAGVGMAAAFGAAANAPVALSIMAVELLGFGIFPHVALVVVIAYLLSGHRGIYTAQRIHRKKLGPRLPRPVALRDYVP